MSLVSVFLSDFQYLTKEGFRSLIEKEQRFELVGSHDETRDLVAEIRLSRPQVLIIDYRADDRRFKLRLERIRELQDVNILIVTGDTDKSRIKEVLKTGVKGMITKTCSRQEIVDSILAIAKGNRFYCNRILDIVMENNGFEEDDCTPTDLSPRELEVLRLITKGYTTNRIADQLFVSVHTINSHRKSILKKLNLRSPTELIVYALQTGIVQ